MGGISVVGERLDPPDLLVFVLSFVLLVDLDTGVLIGGVGVPAVKDC